MSLEDFRRRWGSEIDRLQKSWAASAKHDEMAQLLDDLLAHAYEAGQMDEKENLLEQMKDRLSEKKGSSSEDGPAASLEQIREERGACYGDAKTQHDNLGMMYTGVIQQHYDITLPHPIPGHIVALLSVCIKANRASNNGRFLHDNYDDGKNYFDIARDSDERNPAVQKGGES